MSLVIRERDGAMGVVTMNHPSRRNALSKALVNDILAAFDTFRSDRARAVVLRAVPGSKVWSAGHDVNELPRGRRDPLGWDDPLRILIRAIEDFPAPVIAQCDGGVWGGACEVALACDIIIATPRTTFAVTPAKLGVPYNATGLLTFFNTVGYAVLKEMVFTARPIEAERAERLGIVNHVVPEDEIDAFVRDMADAIAENSPLSVGVIKEQLRVLASAHAVTPRMFERLQGLRRTVYDSHDYEEGINAFLEKRKPNYRGD